MPVRTGAYYVASTHMIGLCSTMQALYQIGQPVVITIIAGSIHEL